MLLSINIFDIIRFEDLRNDNEYIKNITPIIDGGYFIDISDIRELERLLNKNSIRYKIKSL